MDQTGDLLGIDLLSPALPGRMAGAPTRGQSLFLLGVIHAKGI